MKCIFMYNPNSGKGKIVRKLDLIETTLKSKYKEVTMYATKSGLDTREVAYESCTKYDAIIFSGGDGTFNEVLTGVSKQDIRPILGYIPSGTVNDIARNLGIPRNIKKALKIILEDNIINHDVGKVNDRYFMYVCAMGTFTGVSYRTKQHVKKRLGKLAYALDGIKDIIKPKLSKIVIETKNQSLEAKFPLILILNSVTVGGFKVNKWGHLNDGTFDVILIKNDISKGLFNILKLFIFGVRKKSDCKHFTYVRSSEFDIKVDSDSQWCLDGEAGPNGSIIIKNLHNHLKIYAPMK